MLPITAAPVENMWKSSAVIVRGLTISGNRLTQKIGQLGKKIEKNYVFGMSYWLYLKVN